MSGAPPTIYVIDRARDKARLRRREVRHEAGDLIGRAVTINGEGRPVCRRVWPVCGIAFCVDRSRLDEICRDLTETEITRQTSRHANQGRLACRIERDPIVGSPLGDNTADRNDTSAIGHRAGSSLSCQKRRADIHCKNAIEGVVRVFFKITCLGHAGDVHENVDRANA